MARALALAAVLALAAPALAHATGKPLPAGLNPPSPRLTKAQATRIFLEYPKVRSWLDRYPTTNRSVDTTFKKSVWTVSVWWGQAGEIATGKVDDTSGAVTEAWTGPQVAWKMARGSPGAFGGKDVNSVPLWLGFCALFFFGLADLRRPLSLRNLDLLALLSFSVSLWYFNRGDVFTSVPLAYPPMIYLLGRMVWSAGRGRLRTGAVPVWPVWALAAAAVFAGGFRIGLNLQSSNVIDVGYSGVVGADRIAHGQVPYGNFPVEGSRKACGPADSEGEIRNRIQENGRCESANPEGDTYGPVAYEAYLPGYAILGWSGKWDDLPAAHFSSIFFELLCVFGVGLVGLRFGGTRLAVTLAFAWLAYPFTLYASSSNTNDSLPPLFLIWGFWLVTSPAARGAAVALSGWTKFAPLVVAPLWASYPEPFKRPREKAIFVAAFLAASAVAFSILLLDGHPLHAAHVFWTRTLGWQIGRDSPFSLWDWRQYHAGLPDLQVVQRVLEGLLIAGAIASYFLPRRKSPLQLAALTAALLLGFQLVLTHWSYLYLPWFFPFAAFAVLAPVAGARAGARIPAALSVLARSSSASIDPRRVFYAALAALVVSLTLLHFGFYQHRLILDTVEYHRYGTAIAHGDVPYRDFRIEYPPGALPMFALPAVGKPGFSQYQRRFQVLLGVLAGATLLGMASVLVSLGATTTRLGGRARLLRALAARARLGRDLPLRPLAGCARRGRAGGDSRRARALGICLARARNRREDLPGGDRPDRARVRLADARAARGARLPRDRRRGGGGLRRALSRGRAARLLGEHPPPGVPSAADREPRLGVPARGAPGRRAPSRRGHEPRVAEPRRLPARAARRRRDRAARAEPARDLGSGRARARDPGAARSLLGRGGRRPSSRSTRCSRRSS